MKHNSSSFRPALSWQGKVAATVIKSTVKPAVNRLRFSRRFMKFSQYGFDALTLALPVPADVHIAPTQVGGVPGEWLITGRRVRSNRVVLYFHGGGYFFGSPRSHRAVTWRLSHFCKAKVLALDYRQPPDWAYPAPLEDAVRAYRGLLERGYDPAHIVFAGDSAGGNLVLVALLRLRELGLPMPVSAVLISPWTDLTCSGESVVRNQDNDPLIPARALRFVARAYSADENPASPMLSPVFADLSGLPPLLIQVGDTEVVYSDAVRLADNAEKASVSCELQIWQDMPHVFHVLAAWLPEASLALREIGAFVNKQIRDEDSHAHLRARARLVRGEAR